MNDLSTEEQKLLTEWLGECWHEFEALHSTLCTKCNKPFLSQTYHVPRLDFSDWRVVGRLVEKILLFASYEVLKESSGKERFLVLIHSKTKTYQGTEGTPQLAICKAVLAYLKEGEE